MRRKVFFTVLFFVFAVQVSWGQMRSRAGSDTVTVNNPIHVTLINPDNHYDWYIDNALQRWPVFISLGTPQNGKYASLVSLKSILDIGLFGIQQGYISDLDLPAQFLFTGTTTVADALLQKRLGKTNPLISVLITCFSFVTKFSYNKTDTVDDEY